MVTASLHTSYALLEQIAKDARAPTATGRRFRRNVRIKLQMSVEPEVCHFLTTKIDEANR